MTPAERARMVREDCARDAVKVDQTPFTPRGVGELFGTLFAMIAALAKCIEELAIAQAAREHADRLKREGEDVEGYVGRPA